MEKEGLLLKISVWIFYGIGGFCLSSLILLGFFLNFIVDLIPSCGWGWGSLPSLNCGPSFYGKILSYYLMHFSPFSFSVFILFVYFGVIGPIRPKVMGFVLLFAVILKIFIFLIVPLIIAYKLFKRLVWKRRDYSPQQRRTAAICLCLILLPTFCVGILKLTIEPPRFINRTITVDLWHADLKIERRHLEKWSLVSYPKPLNDPSLPGFRLIGSHEKLPFAWLEVPYRELDPSFDDDENIFIKIEPHYDVRTEAELAEKRQKYFDFESSKWGSKDKPIFKPADQQMGFAVFERQLGGWSDFYIHKNAEGKIENLLECTPDTHCVTPFGRGWTQKRCADEDACKSCQRICTDKSLGTEMLNIEYRFDKKYLGSYFALHQEVLDFVAARVTPKPAVKFVFNRQNVKSWREEDIRIKIELTEEGRVEFERLSRVNINKPIDLYIEDLKIGSPVFREAIKTPVNYVFDDPQVHQKVISLLPPDKQEK